MLVLGIETTCDESGCALVVDGKIILANAVASQAHLHAPFGGVVPELASRYQIELLPTIFKQALTEAQVSLKEIDLIAVAKGPGLIGSLLVGLNFAKGLSYSLKKPLIGVNHVEAHLISAKMVHDISLPAIGVVVSGGHTSLYLIHSNLSYTRLGETQDDALGEAFDKVASLLNLPYPGGPEVEKLASNGDPFKHRLKVGQIKGKPFDFSFSGLKTGVLYLIRGQNSSQKEQSKKELSGSEKCDIAASFQNAAFSDLVQKTFFAAKHYQCSNIIVGGGVSQNRALRQLFKEKCSGIDCFFAPPELCLDNGAMIGALGYHLYQKRRQGDLWDLKPEPRLSF